MPLTKIEEKILKAISDNQLITKNELKTILKKDAGSNDVSVVLDSVGKNLIEKKLITIITPIGSTCYVITQKGAQMLNGKY